MGFRELSPPHLLRGPPCRHSPSKAAREPKSGRGQAEVRRKLGAGSRFEPCFGAVAVSVEPQPRHAGFFDEGRYEVSPRLERVQVPDTYPRDLVVLGELHLLRGRLDAMLSEVAHVIETGVEPDEGWLQVEEAARLARRALAAAVSAVPAHPATPPASELCVGELRVDPVSRRQWYGEAEFELTPLHHRLLVVMAADPFRVFGKDELLAEVWCRRSGDGANAVKMSVSRVRRALVGAGAPRGRFMLSRHGVGWALTRPT